MQIYAAKTQQMVVLLEDIRAMNDWIVQDPSLLDRYFSQTPSGGPAGSTVPRNDINKQDVTNAQAALGQVIFAYDSGSPTQKSYILKMIP
jgi:hypothetical protein